MKKTWIVLSAIVLFISNIKAQESFQSSTSFGINSGVNLSRGSFNPSIKQNLYIANSTGFIFRHVSEPHIGLQVEVNIGQKGWIENRDTVGNYTRRLQVIDIPAMAVFILGKKKLRLAIAIGPYITYRRKEKETFGFTDTTYFRDYYSKPLENKWEFGITGGLGIEVHTRIGIFALRGSFSHGLTNLFPLNVPEFYYEDSRLQVVHAGVFYMISL